MDKSSLTDDSLDEVPLNRSGGENPEGGADQGVPPGRAPKPDDADDDSSAGSVRGQQRRP